MLVGGLGSNLAVVVAVEQPQRLEVGGEFLQLELREEPRPVSRVRRGQQRAQHVGRLGGAEGSDPLPAAGRAAPETRVEARVAGDGVVARAEPAPVSSPGVGVRTCETAGLSERTHDDGSAGGGAHG